MSVIIVTEKKNGKINNFQNISIIITKTNYKDY